MIRNSLKSLIQGEGYKPSIEIRSAKGEKRKDEEANGDEGWSNSEE